LLKLLSGQELPSTIITHTKSKLNFFEKHFSDFQRSHCPFNYSPNLFIAPIFHKTQ
jgi:hypothetical protein